MHAHIHPTVTHRPIKTFEPYSKNSEKCSLWKYCAPISGQIANPTTALKAVQKNIQDLLNRSVTPRLGFRKETALELQLLLQSDSKHLQHPPTGVLAVSHGELLFGGLPKDNPGFHTEMPTEGHWCRKLELNKTSCPSPRWAMPGSLLAPWEAGKWQSAAPHQWAGSSSKGLEMSLNYLHSDQSFNTSTSPAWSQYLLI